jgi:hypothetical protein
MSDHSLSRIRQLVALCMLAAAVVTIGLAIAGALQESGRRYLSSHHRNDARPPPRGFERGKASRYGAGQTFLCLWYTA